MVVLILSSAIQNSSENNFKNYFQIFTYFIYIKTTLVQPASMKNKTNRINTIWVGFF